MRHLWLAGILLEVVAVYAQAGEVAYGTGSWPSQLGNHRARVWVSQPADAVRVHIPWRRHDAEPEAKAMMVMFGDEHIGNAAPMQLSQESADIIFEATRAGEYFIYCLPFQQAAKPGFNHGKYLAPQVTADAAWMATTAAWRSLPQAEVRTFEAISDFHRLDPMEIVAASAEAEELLRKHPGQPYLLFAEDRRRPIRMFDALPLCWVQQGPSSHFVGHALRNEYYVFQIGLYAARAPLRQVSLEFSELRCDSGGTLPKEALRCFNLGGVGWDGRRFSKDYSVEQGDVGALWIGVDVPADAAPGEYTGAITIGCAGQPSSTLELRLTVVDQVLADRGDSELWRHSRLRWLDSTRGTGDTLIAPYTPLEIDGATVACLGRRMQIAAGGLPAGMAAARPMLAAPVQLVIQDTTGQSADWSADEPVFTQRSPAAVAWSAQSRSRDFSLTCHATMEFDGFARFELELTPQRDVTVRDIRLEIPLRADVARYMMGMNRKGGIRPASWEWQWNPERHQDSVWLGDWDAGVQCKLKGPNYRRPLVTTEYQKQPLLMPDAWYNGGRGGCRIVERDAGIVAIEAYSGPRQLSARAPLRFDFDLIATPVKPIDYAGHWRNRYYQRYMMQSLDEALLPGVTVVNVHHGSPMNPHINYPFLSANALAEAASQAHAAGRKLKIYYTVRELSNHAPELWALRSLGHEIISDGSGGGYSWLQEHLVDGYRPSWYHPYPDNSSDAAVVTQGMSRWLNYYVEGLAWLLSNTQIDGLYIDDVAFGRDIFQRMRRVMQERRPGSLIDFHSWNHFNARAGYANCANLYLEIFPYLDSIWFGESFRAEEPPDYWLVEMSGIPYGLLGEMLDERNPWRGMLYAMTCRLPWSGNPRPIWKLWDDFGIADSRMIGYWQPDCPVHTDNDKVLATVYVRPGRTLIALASWADAKVDCRLAIEWKALGLAPEKCRLVAPEIEKFQPSATFAPGATIPVEPGKGWLLVLSEDAGM